MNDKFSIAKIYGNFVGLLFLVSMFVLVSKFIVSPLSPVLIPFCSLTICHNIKTIGGSGNILIL